MRSNPMECPHCSHILDAHQAADNNKNRPQDGDFSLCINCYNVNIFENNALRKGNKKDAARLDDKTKKLIQETILLFKEMRTDED